MSLAASGAEYEMDGKVFLEFERTRPNDSVIDRIYHRESGSPRAVVWEFNRGIWAVGGLYLPQWIDKAQRFGPSYCVVLSGGVDGDLEYLRIDTGQVPPAWVKMHIPWKQQGVVEREMPYVMLENKYEFSIHKGGQAKQVFHVHDDGRLQQNGTFVPAMSLVNGKIVDHKGELSSADAIKIWPPKPGNNVSTLDVLKQQDASATKLPPPSVPVALVGRPDLSTRSLGGWMLWAGIASFIAAAAGWLLFRWRRKRK